MQSLISHSEADRMACKVKSWLSHVIRLGLLQGGNIVADVFPYCGECLASPYGLDSCRSTTSESVWPRTMASLLPSKDQ
jgi:hypothetical protein